MTQTNHVPPSLFNMLINDCGKPLLLVASMLVSVDSKSMSRKRKTDICRELIDATVDDRCARHRVCSAVVDATHKSHTVEFLKRNCVTGVSRLTKAQLVEMILGDEPNRQRMPLSKGTETNMPANSVSGGLGGSASVPAAPCDVIVEVGSRGCLRKKLNAKWVKLARKKLDRQAREEASKVIIHTIRSEIPRNPAQTIHGLWEIVVRDVGDRMHRDSATMRCFFYQQLMKFYKIHKFTMRRHHKTMAWVRRKEKKKFCRDANKERMLRHMNREHMKREDILSQFI